MAKEIERKFLTVDDSWRNQVQPVHYRQGYLAASPGCTVRVRQAGDRGYLTIKGRSSGISRSEFEYEIPLADARAMLDELCDSPLIDKYRYRISYRGFVWEVDEFFGDNQGLIVAEIELAHEEQDFPRPPWLGPEVTGDIRYYNASLSRNPYCRWQGSSDGDDPDAGA